GRGAGSPSMVRQGQVAASSFVEAWPVPDSPHVVVPNLAKPMPGTRLVVSPPAIIRELSSHALPVVQPDLPLAIPEAARPQASPAASPESVIHVTIGRLEIRSSEKEKPAK